MRKPETIEKLYLDFDGFFASVMQQVYPDLRGKPVGVIPFDTDAPDRTIVIACSREAKAAGCKNVMAVKDARAVCPDLILVTQRPDLYRRAHNTLINEISCEIPIDTVKSIDELTCTLDRAAIVDPLALAARIKGRLEKNVGAYITCSIGMAPNRMLAKIACKVDKPNGVTIWRPEDLPAPLFRMTLDDIPGVGPRMQERLALAGIRSTEDLWNTQPKQLRALWGNVNGERMWYAFRGYALHAMPTARGMFGHGRVLEPKSRNEDSARSCARYLLTKAARRMRRDGFYAGRLWLYLQRRGEPWFRQIRLAIVQDDHACLAGLELLWEKARQEIQKWRDVIQVGVTLADLTPATARQLDLFLNDDKERKKCEVLTNTIDRLNRKYAKRVVTLGPWTPPGDFAGGKIAFNRIPSAEDFY
jgi:DNA polymerase-4